jgi:hypothetical protein
MAGTDLVKPDDYAALSISKDELRDIVQENLAGQTIGEFDLDRIKMPAGGGTSWEVPGLEGTETKKEIFGVVLLHKESRSFWKEEYSGGSQPPDCSSPDAQFAPPTGEPGVATPKDGRGFYICEQCPNAQFGTAKDGDGPGQACKQTRQLFFLTPESIIPLIISLPPTSVKPARQYFLRLASHGVKASSVVTKITLVKDKNQGGIDYSKAEFAMAGRVDAEAALRISAYADELRPVFARVEAKQEEVSEPAGGGVEV